MVVVVAVVAVVVAVVVMVVEVEVVLVIARLRSVACARFSANVVHKQSAHYCMGVAMSRVCWRRSSVENSLRKALAESQCYHRGGSTRTEVEAE